MIEAGFIEPAEVVRVALQDAASVAGLLITTEAVWRFCRTNSRRAAKLTATAARRGKACRHPGTIT